MAPMNNTKPPTVRALDPLLRGIIYEILKSHNELCNRNQRRALWP